MIRILSLGAAILVASVSPSFAHLNPAEHGSFAAGISHPLFGLDHILAMVAVGIWAAQIGGRALIGVPAAFVGCMALGFVAALAGMPLPFVEPAILASVVALGLLVIYGGMIFGVLPGQRGVSWQSHLFGFGAGIVAAWAMFPRDRQLYRR